MYTNCGMLIDGETLVIVDGILTVANKEEIGNKEYSSVCGGLIYDADEFKIENEIVTLATDEKQEFEYVISCCGQKFDDEYFEVTNNVLTFKGTSQSSEGTDVEGHIDQEEEEIEEEPIV